MSINADPAVYEPFDTTKATEEETFRFLAELQDAIYTAARALGLTHIVDQTAA